MRLRSLRKKRRKRASGVAVGGWSKLRRRLTLRRQARRGARFRLLTFFARVVGAAATLYLLLFSVAFLVLEIDEVQRRLTPRVARLLSDALKLEVEVGRIGLRLFDKIELHNVVLYDKRCGRMIAAEKVRISNFAVPVFAWLHDPGMRKDVPIRAVELHRAELNLYRPLGERVMNIDEAFKSEEPDTSDDGPPVLPRLSVGHLAVRQMTFTLRDSANGVGPLAPRPLNLNYQNLHFSEIALDAGARLWETGELEVDVERLTAREVNSGIVLERFSTDFSALLTLTPRPAPRAPVPLPVPEEYIHPFDETYYPRPHVEITLEPVALHPPAFSLYGYDTVRTVYFRNTCFDAGRARLDFDLRLDDLGLHQLFAPRQNRKYVVDFRRSAVDFAVVNYFTPVPLPLEGVPVIESGRVRGDYRSMRGRELLIRYGEQTLLDADVRLDDFTDDEKLFLDVRLEPGKTALRDLDALLQGVKLPDVVRRIDSLSVVGRFQGFVRDFVVDATVQTPRGFADANLRFVFDAAGNVQYQGQIATQDLNLDRLMDLDGICDRLNVSGRVEGKNFDPETAEGNYVLTAWRSRAVGFDFDTLRADFALFRGRITGHATLSDGEGSFDGTADVNFLDSPRSYEFTGDLEGVDLSHYLDLPGRYFLTTAFTGRVTADSLENLRGGAKFQKLNLGDSLHGRSLSVEHLAAAAYRDSVGEKHVRIAGSPFDLRINGRFGYRQIYRHFEHYGRRLWAYIREDSVETEKLALAQDSVETFGDVALRLADVGPLVQFFEPRLTVGDGSRLNARWSKDSVFVKAFVDTAAFKTVRVRGWETELELARSDVDFSASGFVYAQKLKLSPKVGFVSVQFTPVWRERTLKFVAGAIQDTLDDYFMLKGRAYFPAAAAVRAELDPAGSMFFLLNRTWNFSPGAAVEYDFDRRLKIDNFAVFSDSQQVVVEADVDSAGSDLFIVRFEKFGIAAANPFLGAAGRLGGAMNAVIDVKDLFVSPIAEVNGKIQRFSYDKRAYGDVLLATLFHPESKSLDISLKLIAEADATPTKTGVSRPSGVVFGKPSAPSRRDTILRVDGFYDLADTLAPMHFRVQTYRTPLALAHPFVKDVFSRLEGFVGSDNLVVKGRPKAPEIEGSVRVKALIEVAYLKAPTTFDGVVRCKGDKIVFKDVMLENVDLETGRPDPNRYAVADGQVDLQNFEDLSYEIVFKELKRFRVVGTNKRDNDVFYGNVYLSEGTAKIAGDLGRLAVEASATTGAGTNVNIPIADYTESSRPDYVAFIAPKNPGKSKVQLPQKASSFALDLSLDVAATPDATVNLVFDEAAGDKITANGAGNLHIGLNPEGDFRIDGFYEISAGKYNFNFRNLINKRFSIDPGSTLSWAGDALDARMDIRAVYRAQQASVKAWDTTQTSGVTIDVVMNLKGSLAAPEITYGLQLPAVARQQAGGSIGSNVLAANLRLVEADPQELNRQVFSVIMFDALAPIGSFFGQGSAGGGVSTGLSDFVSAQLNNWIAGTLDQKIGVNFGYAQDQVIMSLRAGFFNDRVVVERNGAITSNRQRDVSLGNINVQVRLLPAGNDYVPGRGLLALEVFNRENVISNAITTTNRGVGFIYRKDFDTFKELIAPAKKRGDKNELPEESLRKRAKK